MNRRVSCSVVLASVLFAAPSFAQDGPPAERVPEVTTTLTTPVVAAQSRASRTGFTFLVNAGAGFQSDAFLQETGTGLAGLNVGAGFFLNDRTAVLVRFSGTNAAFDSLASNQSSGVFGGTVQYWVADRFTIEGGVGMGYWSYAGLRDRGLGIILGAHAVVFSRGRHNLHAGIELAHAFTDPGNVRNLGLVFGYQFHGIR